MEVYKTINYRGIKIDFYFDEVGEQYYAEFNDESIAFGRENNFFVEDCKAYIDSKLDTIKRFDRYTCLKYFKNGNNRDIELIYNKRIIKIYLEPFELEAVKKDAILTLNNIKEASEN